ncbi:MAG: succinate dehydrogenase assembly factor 4 [Gammaproteobacteria bacterium]|jgi:hypothetical protein
MVKPAIPGTKGTSDGTGNFELGENQPRHKETTEPQAQFYRGPVREIGGPAGPEPTRYGDWERNGRCIDF